MCPGSLPELIERQAAGVEIVVVGQVNAQVGRDLAKHRANFAVGRGNYICQIVQQSLGQVANLLQVAKHPPRHRAGFGVNGDGTGGPGPPTVLVGQHPAAVFLGQSFGVHELEQRQHEPVHEAADSVVVLPLGREQLLPGHEPFSLHVRRQCDAGVGFAWAPPKARTMLIFRRAFFHRCWGVKSLSSGVELMLEKEPRGDENGAVVSSSMLHKSMSSMDAAAAEPTPTNSGKAAHVNEAVNVKGCK